MGPFMVGFTGNEESVLGRKACNEPNTVATVLPRQR
jgi:hypothetical protein